MTAFMKKQWQIQSENGWSEIAQYFCGLVRAGDGVKLSGPLGAGKTTFVRAFLRTLGYREPVVSPTYALMVEYQVHSLFIRHLDGFRLELNRPEPWDW